MIEKRQLAAAAGFAFVAAWIGFSFGEALLCLLGAVVFWLAAGVLEGKIDLAQLQSRLSGEDPAPAPPPAARSAAARPGGRPRVQ
jgi:hypothetical protein